ncbi:hypothetical protein LSAT2_008067 [Lamellibrachia satsuma]|nr:hypothetical protein LSAT2_008067 [Lamellibrachia satsuma]
MAGRPKVNRALPPDPVEESDYVDPGFEDGEFDDDYENTPNRPEGAEPDQNPEDEDEDYLQPDDTFKGKPPLLPRQPTGARQLPPPRGQTSGAPVCPPRGKPPVEAGRSPSNSLPPRSSSTMSSGTRGNNQPRPAAPAPEIYEEVKEEPKRQPQQRRPSAPQPPLPDEEYEEPPTMPQETYEDIPPTMPQETYEDMPTTMPQETYEDMNNKVSRPGLPTPMPSQDEYLEPEWCGPTEDYSEIPGGVDSNHNRSAPPLPSDDVYQEMPDPESSHMSAMQKEILGKQLKSTRELPPTPDPQKAKVKGIQMVSGLDTHRLGCAKGGLRPVAKECFEQKTPRQEPSGPDPSDIDFKARAALFGAKVGVNTFQHQKSEEKPKKTTLIREEKPSPRSSTSSNRSDSGVDIRDGVRDIAPESPMSRQQTNRPPPPLPEQRMQPPIPSSTTSTPPIANRSLPPVPTVPADPTPMKRPLPSLPPPSSNSENLSNYPWYFGSLVRQQATTKIEALRQDGAYLVRDSTKDPNNPYTLSLFYQNKVWHLHIRIRTDDMFAIGSAKQDEECFTTIPELIDYHTDHNIILAGRDGGETRLIQYPRK